jgi:hypothetical protein
MQSLPLNHQTFYKIPRFHQHYPILVRVLFLLHLLAFQTGYLSHVRFKPFNRTGFSLLNRFLLGLVLLLEHMNMSHRKLQPETHMATL